MEAEEDFSVVYKRFDDILVEIRKVCMYLLHLVNLVLILKIFPHFGSNFAYCQCNEATREGEGISNARMQYFVNAWRHENVIDQEEFAGSQTIIQVRPYVRTELNCSFRICELVAPHARIALKGEAAILCVVL